MAAGTAPGDAIAELERRLDGSVATAARFLVAQAVHGAGALTAPRLSTGSCSQARPNTAQVRVTLAELLLSLGRHDEAAADWPTR